jgi:hypothetical protein
MRVCDCRSSAAEKEAYSKCHEVLWADDLDPCGVEAVVPSSYLEE